MDTNGKATTGGAIIDPVTGAMEIQRRWELFQDTSIAATTTSLFWWCPENGILVKKDAFGFIRLKTTRTTCSFTFRRCKMAWMRQIVCRMATSWSVWFWKTVGGACGPPARFVRSGADRAAAAVEERNALIASKMSVAVIERGVVCRVRSKEKLGYIQRVEEDGEVMFRFDAVVSDKVPLPGDAAPATATAPIPDTQSEVLNAGNETADGAVLASQDGRC